MDDAGAATRRVVGWTAYRQLPTGPAAARLIAGPSPADKEPVVPIGTPLALLFVSAALIFLPTVIAITGGTLFGG
ncbi:hypothetical protein [Streptacidiphilus sp. MAP5-3]|uniref:hypothetical protein n=1 Tax=unclassified Streptacidiphilus TaxID=2643834 RepID=UPI003517007B